MITRFDARWDGYDCAVMDEYKDGEYVLYEDYAEMVEALESKVKELEEELADRRKSVW